MFKVISLLFIFGSISWAGFVYGETFRKRELQLKECSKIIAMLKNEVIFLCTPIEEAFHKISRKCNEPFKDILINVRNNLKNGHAESVYGEMSSEYEKFKKNFYLEKNDLFVLGDFLKSLGESNVFGQKALFSLIDEELRTNIKEAHDSSNKNVKLYRYLGICSGLMIVIFLI